MGGLKSKTIIFSSVLLTRIKQMDDIAVSGLIIKPFLFINFVVFFSVYFLISYLNNIPVSTNDILNEELLVVCINSNFNYISLLELIYY